MPGINVGPSQGFFGRIGSSLRKNAPAALNRAAQQYGGPVFGNVAKMTGAIGEKRNKGKGGGINTPGNQTQTQNGPGGMAPAGPTPQEGMGGGIVRMPHVNFGAGIPPTTPTGGMPGGIPIPRPGGMNTGITGGMFGPNAGTPPMVPDAGMALPGPGGGLWNAYQNLSNQQGAPNRQLFY